ncbi:stalk domain-containing protein [Paenibacillus sp. FSL H8-0034]|uniref:stalk domain-containing protein n=1 Tax=Paenibacillus sp. FSL H8-0034 TaxID=2954671 RepID=UPI0030FA353E
MKSRFSFVFFIVLLITILVPVSASANESDYTVYINDKQLKTENAPITRDNAIYVPLWSVLGQLNMSAEDNNGVLKINHPYRILLIKSDQNMMTYFGRGMDEHNTRLDYPIISQDYVLYAPLTFLSEYLNMQIAYGENGRIDITAGDFSKDISWTTLSKNKYTIDTAAKKLYQDSVAESFWSNNPVLWNKNKLVGNVTLQEKYVQQTIVSYSGLTVTFVNSEKQYTVTFNSLETIANTFLLSDPLDNFTWSKDIKTLIRQGYARIGMTQEMAILSWGVPDDVNKSASKYLYSEQWVYKGSKFNNSYLYFDETGKITSIQN